MGRYSWSPEHRGPVVTGDQRERRWLVALPVEVFSRVEAAQVWGVGLKECRRRLQALVLVEMLVRVGKRPADGLGLYRRREMTTQEKMEALLAAGWRVTAIGCWTNGGRHMSLKDAWSEYLLGGAR